jgi:hypothetical protein
MAIRNNPIQSYLGQVVNDLVIDGLYGRAKYKNHPIFYGTCKHCKSRNVVTFLDYKNGTAKCAASLCLQRQLKESSERRDDLSTQREWKQGLADDKAKVDREERQRLAEVAERQRGQDEARRRAALSEESGYDFYSRTKQRLNDTPISLDLWLQQSDETRQRLLDACTEAARAFAESEAPARFDKEFEEWQAKNPNAGPADWLLEKELRQHAIAQQ